LLEIGTLLYLGSSLDADSLETGTLGLGGSLYEDSFETGADEADAFSLYNNQFC